MKKKVLLMISIAVFFIAGYFVAVNMNKSSYNDQTAQFVHDSPKNTVEQLV